MRRPPIYQEVCCGTLQAAAALTADERSESRIVRRRHANAGRNGISLALTFNVASAEAADWCAWYGAYTYNCGFHTLDQCRATVSGDTSAFCARNVAPGSAYNRRPTETPDVSWLP